MTYDERKNNGKRRYSDMNERIVGKEDIVKRADGEDHMLSGIVWWHSTLNTDTFNEYILII